MQQHGIRPDQVMQVRGFAEQRLRKPEDPEDPSNRRVSLIVEYQTKAEVPSPTAESHGMSAAGENADEIRSDTLATK
jgi:chemotaxis protein MotB